MEELDSVVAKERDDCMNLPPGFRFHPTDEEIIVYYLTEKVIDNSFTAKAMGEVDLNKCEPWDLPGVSKMGENEWYFFCQRDRKYPTGMRTNRATVSGYWKATGKDKEIYKGKGGNCLLGMKKTLVFYKGRAPRGEKTNWVMHEYRLEGKQSYHNLSKVKKDEWVVCRVLHKNVGIKSDPSSETQKPSSFAHDFFDSSRFNSQGFSEGPVTTSATMGSNGIPVPPYFSNGMEVHQEMKTSQSDCISSINRKQTPFSPLLNSIYYPSITPENPFSLQGLVNSGYFNQEANISLPRFPSLSFNGTNQAMLEDVFGKSYTNFQQSTIKPDTENSSVVSRGGTGRDSTYDDREEPFSSSDPLEVDCLYS